MILKEKIILLYSEGEPTILYSENHSDSIVTLYSDAYSDRYSEGSMTLYSDAYSDSLVMLLYSDACSDSLYSVVIRESKILYSE